MGVSQREFPFPAWDRRDRWLQAVPLRSFRMGAVTVSAATLSAVLCVIGRFPECWLSQESIALRCRFKSRKTVSRAIKALTEMNLVTTDRKWNDSVGAVVNHHRVVWEELQTLCHTKQGSDQRDNQSLCSADPRPTKGTMSTDQRDNEYPTKGTMSADQRDNESHRVIRKRNQPSNSENVVVVVAASGGEESSQPGGDVWSELITELLAWGMADAEAAVVSARDRGVSPGDVRQLAVAAQKLPGHVAPGKLHKWLTGRQTPPPSVKRREKILTDEQKANEVRRMAPLWLRDQGQEITDESERKLIVWQLERVGLLAQMTAAEKSEYEESKRQSEVV